MEPTVIVFNYINFDMVKHYLKMLSNIIQNIYQNTLS